MFKVKFSATVYNGDSEESFYGWVDPSYSMWTLFHVEDSPKVYEFDTRAEAEEFVESTIGAADNYDGEDWYAADSKMNLESGEDWSYAAHITEA